MVRPLITSLLACCAFTMLSCSSFNPPPEPLSEYTNPLPPCPDSPNCERISGWYSNTAEELLNATESAVKRMGAFSTTVNTQELSLHSVFKIPVFGWKDDLNIVIEPTGKGSVVHFRSASRVGNSDLGVNKRRLNKLFKLIDQTLKAK